MVSAFMHRLRERTGEDLENWLDTVEQSQLVELAPLSQASSAIKPLSLPDSRFLGVMDLWKDKSIGSN